MNSIIVPCHAMSAVMEDVPTGTTAERTCQSPRSESGVTMVLVMTVAEESAEGTESCFSHPERAKSVDIQRIKILKYLQIGGGDGINTSLAAGFRLVAKVSLVYVFEASIITFIVLMTAKVQRIFETTKYFRDFFVGFLLFRGW